MNAIRLLKTNRTFSLYSIITWLFILCGGKFYLDYILITNPKSKNPTIQILFGFMSERYTANDYNNRYMLSYSLGIVHIIAMILYAILGQFLTISNLLCNIYPIIVQIYIGYRCWCVKVYKN